MTAYTYISGFALAMLLIGYIVVISSIVHDHRANKRRQRIAVQQQRHVHPSTRPFYWKATER